MIFTTMWAGEIGVNEASELGLIILRVQRYHQHLEKMEVATGILTPDQAEDLARQLINTAAKVREKAQEDQGKHHAAH